MPTIRSLFDFGGRLTKGTARTVGRAGSGLYNSVLAPGLGKAVRGVTHFGDAAANTIMEHPLKALYIGGTLAALAHAAKRGVDRYNNSASMLSYRYF